MCLSCTGKRWISVNVRKWSVFQNKVIYNLVAGGKEGFIKVIVNACKAAPQLQIRLE